MFLYVNYTTSRLVTVLNSRNAPISLLYQPCHIKKRLCKPASEPLTWGLNTISILPGEKATITQHNMYTHKYIYVGGITFFIKNSNETSVECP